jgi:hypothetical protein
MILTFEGGNEIVRLNIDRKSKILKVTSSQTGYKEVERPYKDLFDKGKERLQELVTDKLNDEDFLKVIVFEMNKHGYGMKHYLR